MPEQKLGWTTQVAYRAVFDASHVQGIPDLPEDSTHWVRLPTLNSRLSANNWISGDQPVTSLLQDSVSPHTQTVLSNALHANSTSPPGKGQFTTVGMTLLDPEDPKNKQIVETARWDNAADITQVRELFKVPLPPTHPRSSAPSLPPTGLAPPHPRPLRPHPAHQRLPQPRHHRGSALVHLPRRPRRPHRRRRAPARRRLRDRRLARHRRRVRAVPRAARRVAAELAREAVAGAAREGDGRIRARAQAAYDEVAGGGAPGRAGE